MLPDPPGDHLQRNHILAALRHNDIGKFFAKALGHKVTEIRPSLVPVESKEAFCKELQGLSLRNIKISLMKDNKEVFSDFGEMLFTHYGVSGPLMLSASSYIAKRVQERELKLVLDLKPALSFEQLEAARWLPYLKKGGTLVTNTQKINPMPVITGAAKYPEGIMQTLADKVDLIALDALSIAKEAGNTKAVNVVLMGVMAKNTDIPYETWVNAVRECVPAKFLEINLRAFDAGYNYTEQA